MIFKERLFVRVAPYAPLVRYAISCGTCIMLVMLWWMLLGRVLSARRVRDTDMHGVQGQKHASGAQPYAGVDGQSGAMSPRLTQLMTEMALCSACTLERVARDASGTHARTCTYAVRGSIHEVLEALHACSLCDELVVQSVRIMTAENGNVRADIACSACEDMSSDEL